MFERSKFVYNAPQHEIANLTILQEISSTPSTPLAIILSSLLLLKYKNVLCDVGYAV